jgi:hypothetical protein
MKQEMKIEQITNGGLSLYQITDTLGATVTLKPDEAVLVLDFLYRNLDELTRQVSGLEASEEATNPYQLSDGFIEVVLGNRDTSEQPGPHSPESPNYDVFDEDL